MSARVRDELWKRVCDECKSGRATMVYSARNEQRLNFKVHNTTWEPIDFDGIKLMLHPSPARTKTLVRKRMGWSDASEYSKAKRGRSRSALTEPGEYVVVDLETTGLDVDKDEVIEIAAIKVVTGEEADRFHALIRSSKHVPKGITELTGITEELLNSQGVDLELAMERFISFVGEDIVVAHNAAFDSDFIQASCEECDLDDFDNECIDTVALAKKKMPKARNYQLSTLLDILNLDNEISHRAESDCDAALQLFRKLIEI